MTIADVERDILSLRTWVRRTILPVGVLTLAALLYLRARSSGQELDHSSVLVAFFALYMILVRGGHMLMIRSLHSELKRKYPEKYAEKLAGLPSLKGRNAGFTLARLKRQLIDDGEIQHKASRDHAAQDSDWDQRL